MLAIHVQTNVWRLMILPILKVHMHMVILKMNFDVKGICGFLKICPQGKGRMYLTKNIYPRGKHVRCWL
jgi:hypothetical protein